jgi:hypothetical protein
VLSRYKKECLQFLEAEREKENEARKKLRAPPAPTVVDKHSVAQLLAIISSLSLLKSELLALEETVQQSWPEVAGQPLFGQASAALLTCRLSACARASHLIVFSHCKSCFVEGTYAFSCNASTRLPTTLLDPLNDYMERVCACLNDDERAVFSGAALEAVAVGLQHILLDGGPSRFFTREDASLVREDLQAVTDFFVAGGDGIEAAAVRAALQPALHLVDLMDLETAALFQRYNAAKGSKEETTLLHILSHRAEREASKLLKESLAMPKPVGRFNLLLGPRVKTER